MSGPLFLDTFCIVAIFCYMVDYLQQKMSQNNILSIIEIIEIKKA